MSDKIQSTTVAQPTREGKSPEWFCQWLKGYLGGIPGRDELDAFEANSIRNTLNEVLAAQPPAAPVEAVCTFPDCKCDRARVMGSGNCPSGLPDAPPERCSAGSVPTNRQLHDAIAMALNQEGLTYSGIQQAVFAVQDLYGAVPQAAPVIVGYQRRNIGPDGTPWSSWYPANDEPTPENMKFDGYLSYEYRPVHAGSPLPRPKLGSGE